MLRDRRVDTVAVLDKVENDPYANQSKSRIQDAEQRRCDVPVINVGLRPASLMLSCRQNEEEELAKLLETSAAASGCQRLTIQTVRVTSQSPPA